MASPIAGAGIATVLSQLVTCMGLYGIMKKRGMLPSWGDLRGLPTKKQSTPYVPSGGANLRLLTLSARRYFRFYKLTVLAAARLAVYAVVTRCVRPRGGRRGCGSDEERASFCVGSGRATALFARRPQGG
jgi:hypothetical protein